MNVFHLFTVVVAFIFTGLLARQFIQRARVPLKEIGRENILLYATPERLVSLNSSPLTIDTWGSRTRRASVWLLKRFNGPRETYHLQSDPINQEPRPTGDLDDESRRTLLCLSI